jgi:putative nucleotidyltransferase-like protein
MPSVEAHDREQEKQAIYAEGLRALVEAKAPFLVGGGFALYSYLGRWRSTKDVDVFIAADDLHSVLHILMRAGFVCEITDAAWLAKARKDDACMDVIFCSYNGMFPVDKGWFDNARRAVVLGMPCKVVGPEEIIVSKAFVAARDRFDGADISWLLRATANRLDWDRIERIMGEHWQVLLWQLLHFLYVFPSERHLLPAALMQRLIAKLADELGSDDYEPLVCRGPMLDPKLYQAEIVVRGAADPRPRRDLVPLDEPFADDERDDDEPPPAELIAEGP